MKKAFLLGSMVVLALFLAPGIGGCASKAVVADAGTGGPRAVVEKPSFDGGEVPQGKDVTTEFLLKNAGKEPLTFKVRPC